MAEFFGDLAIADKNCNFFSFEVRTVILTQPGMFTKQSDLRPTCFPFQWPFHCAQPTFLDPTSGQNG